MGLPFRSWGIPESLFADLVFQGFCSPHIEQKYNWLVVMRNDFIRVEFPHGFPVVKYRHVWIHMVVWKSECMWTVRGRRSTLDIHQNFVAGAASALHDVAGLICRKKRKTRIAMLTCGVAAQCCDNTTFKARAARSEHWTRALTGDDGRALVGGYTKLQRPSIRQKKNAPYMVQVDLIDLALAVVGLFLL